MNQLYQILFFVKRCSKKIREWPESIDKIGKEHYYQAKRTLVASGKESHGIRSIRKNKKDL